MSTKHRLLPKFNWTEVSERSFFSERAKEQFLQVTNSSAKSSVAVYLYLIKLKSLSLCQYFSSNMLSSWTWHIQKLDHPLHWLNLEWESTQHRSQIVIMTVVCCTMFSPSALTGRILIPTQVVHGHGYGKFHRPLSCQWCC